MEKFRVAIIGCGAIHRVHADAIMNSELAQLKYVVDIQPDRARASGEKYGCQWYTDYKEMLQKDDIDVVHICTPHYLHAGMTINSVQSGKHVFVEKPVVSHLDQAREVAEEAAKSGCYVGVCFQNRLNPTSVKAKEIIDSGRLGRILGIKGLVTWYRDEAYYRESGWRGFFATEGGGVLINQSIHTLDLMQWLGGGVEAVKGNVATRVLGNTIEVEDTADATLFFRNGARGIFYATNCYTTNSPVEIEVHCEKGTLRIYNGELYMISQGKQTKIIDENREDSPYKSYWGNSHSLAIHRFYQSILHNEPKDFIPVEQGVEAVKIIDAIYKSSSTGNKIII